MNCQDHLYRGLDAKTISRRWFLQQCGVGLGAISLGQLFRQSGYAAAQRTNPLAPKEPPFAAKASACIVHFTRGFSVG